MKRGLVAGLIALSLFAVAASAAEMPEYKLVIKDHKFQPTELTVPANTKFKVLVSNQDATPSEFESNEFNREKIVLPNSQITVFIGPLDKGRYKFFDDFHQDTGNGVLIVQ
ncbi:MAG TPA: cupredoxin domain-containing protein [Rhodanobacteraceae bacterium]|nr:cupredoxin domain-containing protein [Rhodanobacteraceae bacterium]